MVGGSVLPWRTATEDVDDVLRGESSHRLAPIRRSHCATNSNATGGAALPNRSAVLRAVRIRRLTHELGGTHTGRPLRAGRTVGTG